MKRIILLSLFLAACSSTVNQPAEQTKLYYTLDSFSNKFEGLAVSNGGGIDSNQNFCSLSYDKLSDSLDLRGYINLRVEHSFVTFNGVDSFSVQGSFREYKGGAACILDSVGSLNTGPLFISRMTKDSIICNFGNIPYIFMLHRTQ